MGTIIFYCDTYNSALASYDLWKGDQRFLYCQAQLLPPWSIHPFLGMISLWFWCSHMWCVASPASLIPSHLSFSFTLWVPGSLQSGPSSQAVCSWPILSMVLSFTLVVLTAFSKMERTSSCVWATGKPWAVCLCTLSTLNSAFQKLSTSLLSSPALLVPHHAGITG